MKKLIIVFIIIFFIPVLCIGDEFKIPHRLEAGQDAVAEVFNDNNKAIEDEINKLIGELESKDKQISTLRKELDSLKNKMTSIPSPSIVHTKSWNITKNEKGTTTTWDSLPTDMALPITTGKSTLLITADISRIQHHNQNTNTEFRIWIVHKTLKDRDIEVARSNTGNHYTWAYVPLTLHGATEVEPGDYIVRVQYKTQSGTVEWADDRDGRQNRRLTVLEVPKH